MTFIDWIDNQLKGEFPEGIIAYCFNLYETEDDNVFDVQLIGSREFDRNNDDWACNEAYSSGEDVYSFKADDWEVAMDKFGKELKNYLLSEKCSDVLKQSRVAYGFIDGDLEYVN